VAGSALTGSTKNSGSVTGSIIVAPISSVAVLKRKYHFSHVISIIGTSDRVSFPSFNGPKVLRLGFDDVGYSSYQTRAPDTADINSIIAFARIWNGEGDMLIHCRAGTSRSPAAAMIVLAAITVLDPTSVIKKLLALKSYYRPNTTMLRIAGQVLESGRLLPDLAHHHTNADRPTVLGPARLFLPG